MKFLLLLTALLWAMLSSAHVRAQDNLRDLFERAERGDADAQCQIGELYQEGRGLPQDTSAAAKWYLKAIQSGHPTAMANLSLFYEYGMGGMQKDEKKKVELLVKSANAGSARGKYFLGSVYEYGASTIPPNPFKAFSLYKEAAELGYSDAQRHISHAYTYGKYGQVIDMEKAHYWIRLSARQGNPFAFCDLTVAYEEGKEVKKNLVLAYAYASIMAQIKDSVCNGPERVRKLRKSLNKRQIQEGDALAKSWQQNTDIPMQAATWK